MSASPDSTAFFVLLHARAREHMWRKSCGVQLSALLQANALCRLNFSLRLQRGGSHIFISRHRESCCDAHLQLPNILHGYHLRPEALGNLSTRARGKSRRALNIQSTFDRRPVVHLRPVVSRHAFLNAFMSTRLYCVTHMRPLCSGGHSRM